MSDKWKYKAKKRDKKLQLRKHGHREDGRSVFDMLRQIVKRSKQVEIMTMKKDE